MKLVQLRDEQGFVNTGEKLTGREKDVLQLLAAGNSNRQIALQLRLSVPTVEFHTGRIFQKIGVRSRVEAAVWAKTHHLI